MPFGRLRAAAAALRRAFLAIAIVHLAAGLALADNSSKADGMIYQLRIYEIFDSNKAAFHARFRDHAMRIMRRYDFDITAAWETKTAQRTEFVYVVRWPDEATMKDRWARFMADEEWARIKRETAAVSGDMVGGIEERILQAVDYSPGQWR